MILGLFLKLNYSQVYVKYLECEKTISNEVFSEENNVSFWESLELLAESYGKSRLKENNESSLKKYLFLLRSTVTLDDKDFSSIESFFLFLSLFLFSSLLSSFFSFFHHFLCLNLFSSFLFLSLLFPIFLILFVTNFLFQAFLSPISVLGNIHCAIIESRRLMSYH